MEEYRISLEAVRERKGDIQKNLGMGGGRGQNKKHGESIFQGQTLGKWRKMG